MKYIKSHKKILIIIAILIIAAVVLSVLLAPKEQTYAEEIVKTKDIITYYSFSGNIEAENSQTVYSKNMLPIKKIYVKEGQSVKKGDLLFVFDQSSLSANIDAAAASLQIAKINYEKAKTSGKNSIILQAQSAYDTALAAYNNAKANLDIAIVQYSQGAITETELAAAQASFDAAKYQLSNAGQSLSIAEQSADQNIKVAKEQLNQAQANYDSISRQANELKVTSEIDGEISDITAKENQTVAMGSPVMNIVNYDTLVVTVKVDEYDLSAVSEGKKVSLKINALDLDIGGVISKVSKKANVVNGISFFSTKITIEPNENLRVGMSCEIKIPNKSVMGATMISMKALQFDNYNQPYIYYRDENDKIATRKVKVGINDGISVEILEGLKSGDVILVPQEPNFNPFDVIAD